MHAPPTETPAPERRLRADAARNRLRILDAARSAFAERGLDVGVEEIARRAGVGKGTLYRRFPTKEALVRAIFETRLDELARRTREIEAQADPWSVFGHFMSAAAAMQAADQAFFDVVGQRFAGTVLTAELRERFLGISASPLRRAQAAGAVRADLVADDVPMLLRMVGATTRPAPDGCSMTERWPRYLTLLLEGLRPPAAARLS